MIIYFPQPVYRRRVPTISIELVSRRCFMVWAQRINYLWIHQKSFGTWEGPKPRQWDGQQYCHHVLSAHTFYFCVQNRAPKRLDRNVLTECLHVKFHFVLFCWVLKLRVQLPRVGFEAPVDPSQSLNPKTLESSSPCSCRGSLRVDVLRIVLTAAART